ncbi:hypothetical protein [Ekhidna sp.]
MRDKQNQATGLIFISILGLVIIVLRIRKMIHLSMIGEKSDLDDWLMLITWIAIIVFNLIRWRRGERAIKKMIEDNG